MLTRTVDVLEPPHPFAGLRRRHYRFLMVDAPTEFKSFTALQTANWHSRRDVEKHYRTMSFEQLAALPVRDLCHPDGAHLGLWATGPNLLRYGELITAWGFKYSWDVWGDQINKFDHAGEA